MDDQARLAKIEKSLATLKILTACVLFMNMIALAWILLPFFLLPAHVLSTETSSQEFPPSWQTLTLEQKIAKASVIVITKSKTEDGNVHGYITEVLKRAPGVHFSSQVGDEVPDQERAVKPNVVYGDGAVVFFLGSSAIPWSSSMIYGGTIPGLHDISVDELRRVVAAAN